MVNTEDLFKISIEDYNYPLPKERIAQYPLQNRDASKLLVNDGQLHSTHFENIADYLPQNSVLVFNNTKVVQARLFFRKETGALIEIFCLEPELPTREIQDAFAQKSGVQWKCLIGNRKKWKAEQSLHIHFSSPKGEPLVLSAQRLADEGAYSQIHFSWNSEAMDFGDILTTLGNIPLPPYMQRESEASDHLRYQTVYAKYKGSVAAPTAGLHFTEKVFASLAKKGIERQELTLHVGAGTFKPVSSEHIGEHSMHQEQILIKKAFIHYLMTQKDKMVVAVGTTSVRSLESIYWIGVQLLQGAESIEEVKQWVPYEQKNNLPSKQEALQAVYNYLESENKEELRTETQIMIAPSYRFRVVEAIITNFHQPKSTLLLLIAAYLGNEWKAMYQYALNNDYRFLSYGDSCLLLNTHR